MTHASDVGHQAGQPVYLVDADIVLSVANEQPFHGGLLPIDPSAMTVVSNWWTGENASPEAAYLLLSMFGLEELPEADDEGNLTLPAGDLLSGTPSVAALRQIYARLRRPDGCPWDREQTELSTVPHILEEAEELREALEREDWGHAAEELGDVLGNVIMIAQIAAERGAFTFEDVVASINAKLVRRHPHVFGDMQANSPDEVLDIWNAVKQQERANQTSHENHQTEESELV